MLKINSIERLEPDGDWSQLTSGITLPGGSSLGVVGDCDTGKTDIGLLLSGLRASGRIRADIHLQNEGRLNDLRDLKRSRLTAFVPTDPYQCFSGMKETLRGEFHVGMQILGDVSRYAQEKVRKVVHAFELEEFLDRDPFTLSGGEAVRAGVALAAWKQPVVMVLDQTFEALHKSWMRRLRSALQEYLPPSAIIIETHSRVPSWSADWSHEIRLRPIRETEMRVQVVDPCCTTATSSAADYVGDVSTVLEADGLEFRYDRAPFSLGPINLVVRTGEQWALVGPNGAGKTTLAKCLACIIRPVSGNIRVRDRYGKFQSLPAHGWEHLWANRVRYAFQNPDEQLFRPTVRSELGLTSTTALSSKLLAHATRLGLTAVLDSSPMSLARPMKRLVTLCIALGSGAPVLILDEPTALLDSNQAALVRAELRRFRRDGGAVIVITHDETIIGRDSRRLEMRSGQRVG